MDEQAEGLLGCIAVPAVIGFVLFALWPSAEERREWKNTVADIEADVRAEQQVGSRLRDPGSAEYSNGRASTKMANVRCGRVNAENAFGGMAGRQRYITTPAGTLLEEDMAPGQMDEAWASMC